jgi:hypothetical protein
MNFSIYQPRPREGGILKVTWTCIIYLWNILLLTNNKNNIALIDSDLRFSWLAGKVYFPIFSNLKKKSTELHNKSISE